MRVVAVLFLVIVALGAPAAAQSPASAQRDEMKKLDWWVGTWEGDAWFMTPAGKRETCTVTETVQSKLGGLAFWIEGVGKVKDGSGAERLVHHAVATLSYDDREKRYRFVSHTMEGRFGEAELKPIEGGWVWGRQDAQGRGFRYTVRLTDDGRWHEKGEHTPDGKTWTQFHEMTLRRVGD